MNYDLIIVELTKPHLKHVIAHQIAADPSVSIQDAMSLLDNLPFVYMKNLTSRELADVSFQLDKLGVVYKAVESKEIPYKHGRMNVLHEGSIETHVEKPAAETNSEAVYKRPKVKMLKKRVTFSGSVSDEKTYRRNNNKLKNFFFSIILIIIVLIIFFVGKNRRYKIRSVPTLMSKRVSSQVDKRLNNVSKREQSEKYNATQKKRKGKRKPITSRQKEDSKIYTDSGVFYSNDFEKAIKFYKIALSFNCYNLSAWHGLIASYRAAGMFKEASDAKKRMEELFNENVFSIENLVKPYGVLSDFSSDNNVCRMEYKSNSVKRDVLEEETFLLLRSLLAQEKCRTISLYASTGKGSGMLVRINKDDFPPTLSDYINKASITFIK